MNERWISGSKSAARAPPAKSATASRQCRVLRPLAAKGAEHARAAAAQVVQPAQLLRTWTIEPAGRAAVENRRRARSGSADGTRELVGARGIGQRARHVEPAIRDRRGGREIRARRV